MWVYEKDGSIIKCARNAAESNLSSYELFFSLNGRICVCEA
jgi:hypothetical protein